MNSNNMVPAGYMYKTVATRPNWLPVNGIEDIHSVSSCESEDFCDWINYWQHNGYWFFNSPDVMTEIAKKKGVDLKSMTLFFYAIYEFQWREDGKRWQRFSFDPTFETQVVIPEFCQLQGYDIVTFSVGNSAECSPLSCNSLAEKIPVNKHCLLDSFDEAKRYLETDWFEHSEPGPYRIFAVYSVDSCV